MTYIDALLLGLLQGITEFLPVSSTGHLILMRDFLGLTVDHGLAVDATLHFATALAVVIYFWNDLLKLFFGLLKKIQGKEIQKETNILLFALILGTIPAVFFGLLFEGIIENVFRNSVYVAIILIIGSMLFVFAEYVAKKATEKREITITKGFYIGLFQALALFPGTSRSGATISGGMLLGLTREHAARFAFLLSLPIIVGAGSMKIIELGNAHLTQGEWFVIGFSAFIAFSSGLLCIHYLLKFLKNHTLIPFVVYRIILAIIVLILI